MLVGNVTNLVLPNMQIDDYVFGVAAIDAAGHESMITAYVAPARANTPIKTITKYIFLFWPAAVFDRLNKLDHDVFDAFRGFDELDPGTVNHDFLVDVADAAVADASLDYDRAVAERQARIMERIALEGER